MKPVMKIIVTLRGTPAEHAKLRNEAVAAKTSLSKYIRVKLGLPASPDYAAEALQEKASELQ